MTKFKKHIQPEFLEKILNVSNTHNRYSVNITSFGRQSFGHQTFRGSFIKLFVFVNDVIRQPWKAYLKLSYVCELGRNLLLGTPFRYTSGNTNYRRRLNTVDLLFKVD